jgi:lysophospholipase L1-like esterase
MKLFFRYIFLLQIFLCTCTELLYSNNISSLYVTTDKFIPFSFEGTKSDEIQDLTHSLYPFYEKLVKLRSNSTAENTVVRIVQIGDSHVRSHEITPALNSKLIENFGNAAIGSISGYNSEGILSESGSSGVICHCIGINGATSQNFLDDYYMTEIQRLQPDLIIISLGTNESVGVYNSTEHYNLMESLFSTLRSYCPAVPVLYTTPPGSFVIKYRKYRKRKRVYTKVVSVQENNNTKKVASTIVRFADNNQVACWDLYNIVGGEKYACKNWLKGNYYQRDKLHFINDGYTLQGNLLYEALINGYNEYVTNKHE